MSALLPVKCGGRGLNAYPYFRCLSQEAKRLSIGCGLYSDHAMVEKILDYAEWVQGERTSSPPGPARCKSKNHERMTPIPPNQPACMHALRCRPSPQAEELVPSSPSLHSLEYPVPRPLPPDWPTPWTTYYLQDVVLGAPISLHIARSICTPLHHPPPHSGWPAPWTTYRTRCWASRSPRRQWQWRVHFMEPSPRTPSRRFA